MICLKDLDQFPRNYLVEPLEEALDLILDRVLDPVTNDQSDVLLLVLFSHTDLGTTLLELDNLLFTELIIFNSEFLINDVGNIVVEHPLERFVVLGIDRLEVSHVDSLAEDLLVEGSTEVCVKQAATVGQLQFHRVTMFYVLKDSLSNDSTDKLEVSQMIPIDTRSLVGLISLSIGSTRFEQSCQSAHS